jgi:predicted acetyltransferase
MEEDKGVALKLADISEAPLLANLLELYQHDLSECFQVDLGADGRFGYSRLPLYWSEPKCRYPLLIRAGNRDIGFVLATVGSPASEDPDVYDIAEFFVLRKYRHSGIGRQAAHLLWDRYRGRWFVRVAKRNAGALTFWRRVIAEYDGIGFTEETRDDPPGWCVFSFVSRTPR